MFVPPEHIFPELEATDRYGAIREILRRLIHIGALPSHSEEPLFAAFRRREKVMSTGIGLGLAFPHVVSDLVTEQVLALGRSKNGVNFASLDGKQVKEIILMISPNSKESATSG